MVKVALKMFSNCKPANCLINQIEISHILKKKTIVKFYCLMLFKLVYDNLDYDCDFV